ncbi:MAG: sterol desaturase family protein [Pseudobdellovibrionaceae bacterium]|nr:sterol desaturase family protein [Pseudobdellovibrionaceae bacterium]
MDSFFDLFGEIPPPFNILLDHGAQTYWVTYIGSAVFAGLVYIFRRREKQVRLRAMLRYIFPKKLFKHPSTRIDIKLYLAASAFIFFQTGILAIFSEFWVDIYLNLLKAFQVSTPTVTPFTVKLIIPLALLLMLELGYWVGHFLLHKVPWLWEFHKVHHSAEIMTPVTELRQHPVELFLVPFVTVPFMALVYAVIFLGYGRDAEAYTIWSLSSFIAIFYFTYGHFRHSHVNVTTSGIWSYIFQSPLHHQIHHSTDPKHFDTNLGFCLSIWDWTFGTLCIPHKGQKITFGIQDDLKHSTSFIDHWVQPAVQSYRVLTGRKKPFSPSRFLQREKNTPEN